MTIHKFNVLTAERLRTLFRYDVGTGHFFFLTRASRRTPAGSLAGSLNNEGYRHIRVDGSAYKAHRLAWLYVNGVWPSGMIDHINGDRDDNRIVNLREATRSENLANSRVFRRGKISPKGVRLTPHGWSARIQVQKQPYFLGFFETEADAVAAYAAAAHDLFGNFAKVTS